MCLQGVLHQALKRAACRVDKPNLEEMWKPNEEEQDKVGEWGCAVYQQLSPTVVMKALPFVLPTRWWSSLSQHLLAG